MQTYEGGLGGEPGTEAHGGYTFCGLAALHLAGRADALSLPALLHWAVHRQVRSPVSLAVGCYCVQHLHLPRAHRFDVSMPDCKGSKCDMPNSSGSKSGQQRVHVHGCNISGLLVRA